jgi:hypothetical protein
MSTQQDVTRVKEQHKETLLAKPNVIGVGVGYKVAGRTKTSEISVVALVRRKIPQAGLAPEAVVPSQVGGVSTDVVEVGDLRALQAPTDRWRPAPGGVSIGHVRVTAGTLGCMVRARSGVRLILSNNHVLANSNDAKPGDVILQPGAVDGGHEPADAFALLERFCPIQFSEAPGTCSLAGAVAAVGNALAGLVGSHHRLKTVWTNPQAVNLADAAVARPLDDHSLRDDILGIGTITGTTPAQLGMRVRKSGRTTGLTTGELTVLNTTVSVGYGPGQTAQFEDQIVSSPMSSPGDSGSLLVAADAPLAVALLFAGSDQATIYNPIQAVMDCLEVTFG